MAPILAPLPTQESLKSVVEEHQRSYDVIGIVIAVVVIVAVVAIVATVVVVMDIVLLL